MKKKNTILMVAGVAVIGIIAFGLFFMNAGKDEGYRMMQVYQIKGNATIEREDVGIMDAYENLNLISGDKVKVAQDSYIRLKVDEDKYVLAEAESVFCINAAGSENSGKTDIQLEQGAITVEVQNKLSDEASFEVTTPNSVMAVRGTVFRISADVDENGNPITKITILEGSVSVQRKDENGNLSDEQMVDSGNEAFVYKDAQDLQIKIIGGISTIDIPLEVLEFLQEIATERRELCVTEEQINELIEQLGKEELHLKTEDEATTTDKTSTTDIPLEASQDTATEREESATEREESATEREESATEQEEPATEQEEPATEQEKTSDTDEEEVTEQPSEEVVEKATYTVTFTYQGKVFATQTVEEGGKVSKPVLMPASGGTWNVDFDAPIYEDMQIEFTE